MTPDDDFEELLQTLATLAAQMKDTCERIIDTVDERSAVRSWDAELGRQLEAIATIHQRYGR